MHENQVTRTSDPHVQRGARQRPMIAVLISLIDRSSGGYEHVLRHAFMAACRRLEFDLVIVSGTALDHIVPEMRVCNEIYKLVKAEHFDGVVLVPDGLCRFTGLDGLLTRLEHLKGLPICSLGVALPEVPSIIADNQLGMAAAVEHIISYHGRKNLAFIGSEWTNFDSNLRRNVFLEVVQRHGLQIPERRMLTCWLEPLSAKAATLQLLEKDPSIDGIIAANDGSAFGAMQALQRLGLRIPDQISVTGYDDLPLAQLVRPSLTSVSQPLAAMATAAIEVIAQQLAGQQPQLVTSLPSALILRHSCGCYTAAQALLSPEELADSAHRSYLERLQLESMYGRLLETARKFTLAVNSPDLERLITEHLPLLHPLDCFIGLYSDESHSQFRPLLPQRLAASQPTILANASVLSQIGSHEHPRALLMLGLAFRTQLLGVVSFELGDQDFDYKAICDHLASALQVVALHEKVVERSQQERRAAADRSRAMSALASGVAHDLNNALGSLVSLSDVVCDEIEEHRNTAKPLTSEVVVDLRTIKSSALRAAETIKDLMTFGRMGRSHQEPFDLSRLTRRVVEEQKRSLAKTQAQPISLNLDSAEQDLIVAGSEPHVERAVGNVLRNATEAVSLGGQINVAVSTLVLDRPLPGHESIPPGSYAVVSISDTGPGIPVESQKRIFEPFFSTKRLGESSGSGLGLAIVYSVIKEHRGYVDVTSALGHGSRFTLYFPRTDSVPRARQSTNPVASGSARILVVDDDLTQLRTANRVLSRYGYDVSTMTSGARAYELVAMEAAQPSLGRPGSSSYDLLIFDLALNEENDGLQVFNKIRKLFPRQKGILASGHAFVDHEEQIRNADLVWLPKPYTIESLTTAIRTALRE